MSLHYRLYFRAFLRLYRERERNIELRAARAALSLLFFLFFFQVFQKTLIGTVCAHFALWAGIQKGLDYAELVGAFSAGGHARFTDTIIRKNHFLLFLKSSSAAILHSDDSASFLPLLTLETATPIVSN